MRYLIIVSFLFWFWKVVPKNNADGGDECEIFYNNQNESHILSEASTEPGLTIGGQLQLSRKKERLCLWHLWIYRGKHQTCGQWFGRVLANKCRISFFQLGLAAYTFNGHIKSWSGGIGLRADVVLFEKSQEIWIDNNGARAKTKIFTSLIPGYYKDLKLDQVFMWRRRYSWVRNAIKPSLQYLAFEWWSEVQPFQGPGNGFWSSLGNSTSWGQLNVL